MISSMFVGVLVVSVDILAFGLFVCYLLVNAAVLILYTTS